MKPLVKPKGFETLSRLVHRQPPPGGEVFTEAFLTFSDRNRISGTLFPMIQEIPAQNSGEQSVREIFRKRFLAQWAFNERLLKIQEELCRLFKASGRTDDVIFLGGVLLSKRIYANNTQAFAPAVELLVPSEERVADVGRDLAQRGFFPHSSLFYGRFGARFVHGAGYARNSTYVNVYWNLCPPVFHVSSEQLWKHKEYVRENGFSWAVLSSEYELVWKGICALKNLEAGKDDALLDLFFLLRRAAPEMDWKTFFIRRRAEGLEALFRHLFWALLRLFDAGKEFPGLEEYLRVNKVSSGSDEDAFMPGGRPRVLKTISLYPLPLFRAAVWKILGVPFRHRACRVESPAAEEIFSKQYSAENREKGL